jgi:hypothetical protein
LTIRAVKEAVRATIDGLTVATINQAGTALAVVAQVQPPPSDVLEAPRVWIWAGTVAEKRLGGPRVGGVGTKQDTYTIQLAPLWNFDPSNSDPSQFDDLLNALLVALRTMTIPQRLTDATTGAVSDLIKIGEDLRVECPPPAAFGTGELLLYTAVIEAEVWELVRG